LKPSVTVSAVKADIDAALKRTAVLDGRKVAVSVQGGEVTLSGAVHNWDERDTVTNAAWGSPGVRKVIDLTTLAS
jgi:osmotically-inducible protein OsmY